MRSPRRRQLGNSSSDGVPLGPCPASEARRLSKEGARRRAQWEQQQQQQQHRLGELGGQPPETATAAAAAAAAGGGVGGARNILTGEGIAPHEHSVHYVEGSSCLSGVRATQVSGKHGKAIHPVLTHKHRSHQDEEEQRACGRHVPAQRPHDLLGHPECSLAERPPDARALGLGAPSRRARGLDLSDPHHQTLRAVGLRAEQAGRCRSYREGAVRSRGLRAAMAGRGSTPAVAGRPSSCAADHSSARIGAVLGAVPPAAHAPPSAAAAGPCQPHHGDDALPDGPEGGGQELQLGLQLPPEPMWWPGQERSVGGLSARRGRRAAAEIIRAQQQQPPPPPPPQPQHEHERSPRGSKQASVAAGSRGSPSARPGWR
jgi:hypothetical protein